MQVCQVRQRPLLQHQLHRTHTATRQFHHGQGYIHYAGRSLPQLPRRTPEILGRPEEGVRAGCGGV